MRSSTSSDRSEDFWEMSFEDSFEGKRILIQLVNDESAKLGDPLDVSVNITTSNLHDLCTALSTDDATIKYSFYIKEREIIGSLAYTLEQLRISCESVVEILCVPEQTFKVRSVTRCTSSLPGHDEAITIISFSPDGSSLATGSGDSTVRLWDLSTETPLFTLKGHSNWILALAWSPNGRVLVSGCKSGEILMWDPRNGTRLFTNNSKHKGYITYIVWEPLHLNKECRRFASSSKDSTIIIWDSISGMPILTLSSHTLCVTCIKWGITGYLYSSSHDLSVRIWDLNNISSVKILKGHSHRVNHIALNSDFVCRTGPFDPDRLTRMNIDLSSNEALFNLARERVLKFIETHKERLVSCSDDFSMYLWDPENPKNPICRISGHQAVINHVLFSPDCRFLASASFDKSVKLWSARDGKLIASFRGHVKFVYQIAWSPDSRFICSSSADSTLKVWCVQTKKLLCDLSGHLDEIFALDWNPNGEKVASGGKDAILKLWRY